MMSLRGQALLAIWSDVAQSQRVDYQHWLTREHVLERVSVDGFLAGRVFRRELGEGLHRYFINYELESHGVLAGPSYMARLNAPTPWSQRIMPILGNFKRGGGDVLARAGLGTGGVVAPIRFQMSGSTLENSGAADALVRRLVTLDGVVSAWIMQVHQAATAVQTKEKAFRKGEEGLFDAVLCIEGLDEALIAQAAASAIADELNDAGSSTPEIYTLMFQLDERAAGLTA